VDGLSVGLKSVFMAGDMMRSFPGDPSVDWLRIMIRTNRRSGIPSCCYVSRRKAPYNILHANQVGGSHSMLDIQ